MTRPSRNKPIPKAIREQVWKENFGEKFKHQCYGLRPTSEERTNWCKNEINVFQFHIGHTSEKDSLNISKLRPLCSRCSRCKLSPILPETVTLPPSSKTTFQGHRDRLAEPRPGWWKCCFPPSVARLGAE